MATGFFSQLEKKAKRNGLIDSSVEHQISQLRGDISKLAKALSARGSDASSEVQSRAKSVRNQAESGLHDLWANSEDILSDLRSRYSDTERQVRHTVREHPLATLGAAAAVGLVIAALLRR
ncbi:DUF883 domain-containing protein [Rhizobium sp. CFBP 8762]|uniref:DUF883 family protein n=1 Tax=Rhizobium sp. CFBP 8762 TaxID=2775279 RepID=UPI001785BF08|nr:DUF883 family protein [Rhizobium sp. CFBP 8762]MBD8556574.1 DUF883 domain-containing protein [Rhizobium sp. CFBP 8762]